MVDTLGTLPMPGTWEPMRPTGELDASGQPILQIGYIEYAAPVLEMQRLFSGLGVVFQFDWPAWHEVNLYPGGVGLDRAPVADACRLATCFIRGERFYEGAIESGFEDGSIPAILNRLRTWWDAER